MKKAFLLILLIAAAAGATDMGNLGLQPSYRLGTPTPASGSTPGVAALGTPTPGNVRQCTNCLATNPCTAGTPGTDASIARAETVGGTTQWNCGDGAEQTPLPTATPQPTPTPMPAVYWLPAAACQNTTAGLLWDTPTSNPAVAACVTGSNTQKGVADFADGADSLSIQTTLRLPGNYNSGGTTSVVLKWLTTATSGDVVWQVATACVADAETDDPSFNTASTVTDTAKGTTNQTNDASIASLTMTGCAAGEILHLKVFRDPTNGSDSLTATARLIGIELTLPR